MKFSAQVILWLEKCQVKCQLGEQKPLVKGLIVSLAVLAVVVIVMAVAAFSKTGTPETKQENFSLDSIEDIPGDPRGRAEHVVGGY